MNKFNIGDKVINLDYLAVIIAILPDGSLVVENPRIGKWIADPSKCRPYIVNNC